MGPKERGTNKQQGFWRLVHFPVKLSLSDRNNGEGKCSQQATRETGMDHGKESESQRSDIDDDCVSPEGMGRTQR